MNQKGAQQNLHARSPLSRVPQRPQPDVDCEDDLGIKTWVHNARDVRLFSDALLVLAALLLYRLLTWKFRQDENSISLWDDVIWQGYHPSHIIPCTRCSERDQT